MVQTLSIAYLTDRKQTFHTLHNRKAMVYPSTTIRYFVLKRSKNPLTVCKVAPFILVWSKLNALIRLDQRR